MEVYQLKISIDEIEPEIWRRILVDEDTLLPDLHFIIQSIFGWYNYHLHQFEVGNEMLGEPDPEFDFNCIDYSNIKIGDVLNQKRKSIDYCYDFGDGWYHTILLEDIVECDSSKKLPVCLDGKRSGPPEDCGGSWGYEDLLNILADPRHKDYEEMKEWVGPYFDPEEFDLEFLNSQLVKEKFGVIDLMD